MNGSDILKLLFKKMHANYALGIAEFEDLVDLGSVDDGISLLTGNAQVQAKANIHQLLQAFKEVNVGNDYLNDPFTEPLATKLLDFSVNGFEKRQRPFSYADTEFGYLSLKKLLKITPLSHIYSEPVDYRVLIDYISTLVARGEDVALFDLFDHIELSHENYGLLVEKVVNGASEISTYSYIYYKKLLSGDKIELDSVLNYNTSHGATTALDQTITYQQYFEVYDIINELNHADDMITRFLKLYHIIEYLMYRVELVELEVKSRINRTFIRDFHSLVGQKTGERNILTKNFKKIFRAELASDVFNLGALTQPQCEFLKNYWEVEHNATFNVDMKKIDNVVNLIYGIRNSIVHNKESEFHLTTSNPDDYQIIIPLIKDFITLLEKQIMDKISANVASLSYQRPHIQLY